MTRKILATTTEQQDVIYKFMETNYIPVREIKLWAHISQIVFKAPFTNNTITADLNKYAISENDKLPYHYLSEVLQALISYIVPQNKEEKQPLVTSIVQLGSQVIQNDWRSGQLTIYNLT